MQTMKAMKNQGGLKLFDLKKKDISLKIQWISVYYHDVEIQTLANTYFGINIEHLMWDSNLKQVDLKFFVKKGFWLDVVKAWNSVTFIPEPINKVEVLIQTIWSNTYVRIKGKPTYNLKAYNAGIRVIGDVMSHEGIAIPYQHIQNIHSNAVNFVEYCRIIEAIDPDWKRMLRSNLHNGESRDNLLLVKLDNVTQNMQIESFIYNQTIDNP